MIGRDRIVVRWTNVDGDPVEKIVYGVVVNETMDGKLSTFGPPAPFGRSPVNYYRLILPRTINFTGSTKDTLVSFRSYTEVRLETPIVRVLDGRGRVHHYEAVVRSH